MSEMIEDETIKLGENAYMSSSIFTAPPTFTVAERMEFFPQLPALAERLGVKPNEGNGTVHLMMKDGTKYDLFALVNACLDRFDAALTSPSTSQPA